MDSNAAAGDQKQNEEFKNELLIALYLRREFIVETNPARIA
jgi:hypothetical protein